MLWLEKVKVCFLRAQIVLLFLGSFISPFANTIVIYFKVGLNEKTFNFLLLVYSALVEKEGWYMIIIIGLLFFIYMLNIFLFVLRDFYSLRLRTMICFAVIFAFVEVGFLYLSHKSGIISQNLFSRNFWSQDGYIIIFCLFHHLVFTSAAAFFFFLVILRLFSRNPKEEISEVREGNVDDMISSQEEEGIESIQTGYV